MDANTTVTDQQRICGAKQKTRIRITSPACCSSTERILLHTSHKGYTWSLIYCLGVSNTHARTHTHTHARAQARSCYRHTCSDAHVFYRHTPICAIVTHTFCDIVTHTHTHTHTHTVTHTWVVYLKICKCHSRFRKLVSPTSFSWQRYQWNGNIVSFDLKPKWRASVIIKLRHSIGYQKVGKKALTDRRRSCDHNSRRRVLSISNWTRTYRGLPLQQV